ncbi:hypothetical protein ACE38W_17665 [Chitinophaga sp. Hz27]|uniref:hypothetical protein n=1 Tax=Chitinophaga sp. Hz27 TaxID=3347169 RepID=UPI0035D7908B
MAKLFIFIPFNKSSLDVNVDLLKDATQALNEFNTVMEKNAKSTIGKHIDAHIVKGGLEIVYADSKFVMTKDDYIIVFAHGSPRTADKLFSNTPDLEVTTSSVKALLKKCNANAAKMILFMNCYSKNPKHIAAEWKTENSKQIVYGGSQDVAKLFTATRNSIINSCIALDLV